MNLAGHSIYRPPGKRKPMHWGINMPGIKASSDYPMESIYTEDWFSTEAWHATLMGTWDILDENTPRTLRRGT